MTCAFWAKTGKENCKDHKQKRIGWGEESDGEVEGGEDGDDVLGFEGDGDDLADEAEDVAVIVFAVDRLGRSGAEVTRTIADLTDRGIRLRTLKEGLDTGTSTGRVIAGIITSLAKLDLEHERQRN